MIIIDVVKYKLGDQLKGRGSPVNKKSSFYMSKFVFFCSFSVQFNRERL